MGPGKGAGTGGREGGKEEENRRTRKGRRTRNKDRQAKKESKEQTVPEGGKWEVWVKREWVSTCVLGLDLDLGLACKMLARFA